MSASTWFALSLLVLAAGVALLGIAGWVRSHREQRTSATLKTALQPRDEARDTEAARRDSLGWLERFGRALSGGRLESALLANEDRLLLDLAGWNTRRGTAIYLGLRLLLGVLVLVLVGVGILNVKLSLPPHVAVAHNAGAAALLFVLVTLLARLREPERVA